MTDDKPGGTSRNSMVSFTFQIDPDHLDGCEAIARAEDRSVSSVMRRAVAAYLAGRRRQ